MKRIITSCLAVLCAGIILSAQSFDSSLHFMEASDLTILGKVFPDTPKPYERMDFERFGGWEKSNVNLLEMSSGIMVCFKTDAPEIYVKPVFKELWKYYPLNYSNRGFDLYIRKDGEWVWAGCTGYWKEMEKENGRVKPLVKHMESGVKECLLYLPTYSKVASLEIGVPKEYSIEKADNPFRYRICIHGSSFMHGTGASRAGQTVPAFLSRATGFEFCSLGVGGDCKMQPQYANALKEADVDAFVFDAFSNGSDKTVEANLFNFIETIQSAKPGVPIIFMRTIRMENRNFNTKRDDEDVRKIAKAEELMAQALKKYKDVYLIDSNAADLNHDTTSDGTHPSDWGYHIWVESVRKPILKILKKYDIK